MRSGSRRDVCMRVSKNRTRTAIANLPHKAAEPQTSVRGRFAWTDPKANSGPVGYRRARRIANPPQIKNVPHKAAEPKTSVRGRFAWMDPKANSGPVGYRQARRIAN